MSTEIFNEALADAFRDVVLELAAVFDIHDVADDAIWASMRRLDRVMEKHLLPEIKNDETGRTERTRSAPHPAVQEMLTNINRVSDVAKPSSRP